MDNRGIRVNMNKTKAMISRERQKLMQKAARWPCGVCIRGVGSMIFGRPYYRSSLWYSMSSVCLSVVCL